MYIIAGLGNPGKKYENTRHNMGFIAIDLLADAYNIKVDKLKFKSLVGEGRIAGQRVLLMKPQTYMNLSGEAIREAVSFYKIDPEELIVIYDDIDIPTGTFRIRKKGSAGTHNGMKSVIGLLGREDFPRVRVGIGRQPEGWDLADWVLAGYRTAEERQAAFEAYSAAADALLCIAKEGCEAAMQKYNRKPQKPREPKEEL